MLLAPSVAALFKWRQFEPEMILLAVGWYLRFSLSHIDKFKPPASDWVYLVECSSKDCDNAEFGDTRKKPLASGTLLTPIGTGTCRSDNETVASFCPAKLSASRSNGSPGQPLYILFVRCGFAEIARHGFLPLFAMVKFQQRYPMRNRN